MLEKIKTPHDLLSFMNDNIKYGYIGKKNEKIYTPNNDNFDIDWTNEYYLQSPQELLNSTYGVCWDQVELERLWFSQNNYIFKTFFLYFDTKENNNLPTHTFLAYKSNNKWYWFEHSFDKHKGIHGFETINEVINEVKKCLLIYSNDKIEYLKAYEYITPPFGCNASKFVNHAIYMLRTE